MCKSAPFCEAGSKFIFGNCMDNPKREPEGRASIPHECGAQTAVKTAKPSVQYCLKCPSISEQYFVRHIVGVLKTLGKEREPWISSYEHLPLLQKIWAKSQATWRLITTRKYNSRGLTPSSDLLHTYSSCT